MNSFYNQDFRRDLQYLEPPPNVWPLTFPDVISFLRVVIILNYQTFIKNYFSIMLIIKHQNYS